MITLSSIKTVRDIYAYRTFTVSVNRFDVKVIGVLASCSKDQHIIFKHCSSLVKKNRLNGGNFRNTSGEKRGSELVVIISLPTYRHESDTQTHTHKKKHVTRNAKL